MSMNDKIVIQRAFNTHFFEFFDDILTIYPDNNYIISAKASFENVKKFNPTSIIKAWYKYVYLPYNNVIEDGNVSFFFEKDYKSDLSHLQNPDEFLKIIEKVREPLQNLNEENKKHASEYLRNLNKLSCLYSQC